MSLPSISTLGGQLIVLSLGTQRPLWGYGRVGSFPCSSNLGLEASVLKSSTPRVGSIVKEKKKERDAYKPGERKTKKKKKKHGI